MKNIYLIILILAVLILAGSGLVFAGRGWCDQETTASDDSSVKSKVIDVSNKICPVLGEPINEDNKATYEYQGKIYNFCCTSCVEAFKKDPQKYIDKMNQ